MKLLRQFFSLKPNNQRLLVSALLLLITVRLSLWLLPFPIWRQIFNIIAQTTVQKQTDLEKFSWAVMTASRCMPEVKCLARALTMQILLLWHGVGANLCIGVAKDDSGKLEAHAWVESQGKIMIGALPDLSRYTPLPSLITKNFFQTQRS